VGDVDDLRLEDCRKVLAALVSELGLVVARSENTACSQGPTFAVIREETAVAKAARYLADRGW
jgi:hypothetical protein